MSRLNDLIDSYIRRNRAQEITGEVLNGILNAIGVGGYTGDNPGVAQDLATVINSL